MSGVVSVSEAHLRLLVHGSLLFVAQQKGDSAVYAQYLDSLVELGGVPELVMAAMLVSRDMVEGS